MSWACSTNEVRYGEGILFGRRKGNDQVSDLGVDGKIKKIYQGTGCVKIRKIQQSCERDEKQLGYVNPVKDLDKMSNYQLLKKDLVPCA